MKKTTGGRAWLPKWGFAGLTKHQKANKRKQRQEELSVVRSLREAAENEPSGRSSSKNEDRQSQSPSM